MARLLVAVAIAAAAAFGQTGITARQVVERIQSHLGVPLPADTVDTFKAGSPDEPVTGIAVTMMATEHVIERAAAAGENLVITHEPTFYSHRDDVHDFEARKDAVYGAKQDFIRQHHMVIWRFHDGWHLHHPDGILLGQTKALGWEQYQQVSDPRLFVLPATTLQDLASSIASKLQIKTLRVVGDRTMRVTRVALQPGAAGSSRHVALLERDDVEVLVIGEVPEWETIEYVGDAVSQGRKKALVLMGHIPSEQAGMEECTRWLETFIHEVPVRFVPALEPFWQPAGLAR